MQKLLAMKKEEIEAQVRRCVRKNIIEHPRAFPDNFIENLTPCKALALSYWDQRNDKEIARDARVGLTESDYINWVIDELVTLKKAPLYN
jgi:hypothetical protein